MYMHMVNMGRIISCQAFSKNFWTILVFLAVFTHTVNSRPPGTVKENAERICSKMKRSIYEAYDNHWCCICPAGHLKIGDCRHGKPATTTCKRCIFDPDDPKNQTFMDVENNSTVCLKQMTDQECLKKMNTRFVLGSHKQPSRCVCQDGYYSTFDVTMYGCNKHSSCDPGHFPAEVGDGTTDTKCSNCPPGTYSAVYSPTATCKTFTKCQSGEIVVFEGNSTHDTICYNSFTPLEISPETPVHTPVKVIDNEEENGNSPGLAWFVILLICGGVLAVLAAVVIIIWKCCCGKREKPRSSDPQCSYIESTSLSVSGGDNPTDDRSVSQSEGSKLLESSDDGSGESDQATCEEETNFRMDIEPGNTVGSSRQDTVVTFTKKTNETKKGNTENSSAKKTEEHSPGTPKHEDIIMELLNEKWKIDSITIKRFQDDPAFIKAIIKKLLKDESLGAEMLNCLNKYSLKQIRPFIRNFLSDTDVDDIESDHRADGVKEIKYRLLTRPQSILGRKLVPAFLLNTEYKKDSFPSLFRDSMLEVFETKVVEEIGRNSDSQPNWACIIPVSDV